MKYVIPEGKDKGIVVTPIKFADGKYRASRVNLKEHFKPVATLAELKALSGKGYRIWMGAKGVRSRLVHPNA